MALYLEFIVAGAAVSHQTGNRPNLQKWKSDIKAIAEALWQKPPLLVKLRFTLLHFHEGDESHLDDDNMVKPIRDALNKLVYEDDRQITYSETIQVSLDAPVMARGASKVILEALHLGGRFIYVRIEDAPLHITLPG